MKPNDNCLENMRCPVCRSQGPFWILSEVSALVFDDGVQEYGDPDWTRDSPCYCAECGGPSGPVKDYYID